MALPLANIPSREEFVELAPDAATPDEIREAREYLLQHGADCIRRGRLLLRLAEMAAIPASIFLTRTRFVNAEETS